MTNRTRRLITCLLASILVLGLVLGAIGCHKSNKPESTDAAAVVTEEDSGFLSGLFGKDKDKTEKETTTEKGTEVSTESTSFSLKNQTTATTVPGQQSSTVSDTAPADTASSGLFQVSQDYKNSHQYAIAVNTAQNIVIVYQKGSDGNFTVPVKAMTASCGRAGHETPSGQYTTLTKQRWLYLIDGTYGQYCTKFKEHYWFHSVPYYSQSVSDLEWPEYNKLGNNASAGCVRLCVRDVKWIYDNISLGTVVRIYSSSAAEPLAKPAPVRIDTSDTNPNRGWDPTDPDAANPYH